MTNETRYETFTNDELLNLAQQRDQLTDEARLALDVEVATRRLSPGEIRAYGQQTLAEKSKGERKKQRSELFYRQKYKKFIGRKNWQSDSRKRVEEFDTTLWFVIGVPIYPLASYRIRRLYRKWWSPCPSDDLHILETRPRDWNQIRFTWAKYGVALVAFFLLVILAEKTHHL